MFSLGSVHRISTRNLSVDSAQCAPQLCLGRQPVCLTSAQGCAWLQSRCIAVAAALCLYRNGTGVICCLGLCVMRLVAVCAQLQQLLFCSCLQQCMCLSLCVQNTFVCPELSLGIRARQLSRLYLGCKLISASYHTRVGLNTYVLAAYVVAVAEPGTGTHRQLFWCSACCIT